LRLIRGRFVLRRVQLIRYCFAFKTPGHTPIMAESGPSVTASLHFL
jgi:hypothetical protein